MILIVTVTELRVDGTTINDHEKICDAIRNQAVVHISGPGIETINAHKAVVIEAKGEVKTRRRIVSYNSDYAEEIASTQVPCKRSKAATSG